MLAADRYAPTIELVFEARRSNYGRVSPLDVSTALYDFTLVYDLALIATRPEYADYSFGNFFVAGRNRPVKRDHYIELKEVNLRSPLDLLGDIPPEVWQTAAGGASIYALYRLIELVYTAPVRLRVAKKRLLVEEIRLDYERREIEQRLGRPEVERTARQIGRRIRSDRLELTSAEISDVPAPPGSQSTDEPTA